MDIFIGQLVGFLVLVFLFIKYVLPPLRKAVAKQQDAIGQQITESDDAKNRAAEAQVAHEKAIERAENEAKELHEGALSDAKSIEDDLKKAADSEVKRISEHGKAQAELSRTSLIRQLRTDLGLTAVDGAGELVRKHLAVPSNQAATIDRVIDELEGMSSGSQPETGIPSNAELIGLHSLHATSREAARAIATEFDSAAADLDSSALTAASVELSEVIRFLVKNPVLRKKITEDEDNAAGKRQLVHSLFDGKVAPIVVDLVATGAVQRWSQSNDLLVALRRQNALVVLAAAERDGTIEQTEDELFRVGRLLDGNPELASLLSDFARPADKRNDLLRSLVGNQVGEHTWYLLSHTINALHGQPAEVAVAHLAELAAARRGETVAHVISAVALTDAQVTRLSTVLANIYHRKISVQTEVDESIIGGLRIGVGDEVIEADIATRLAKAAETLPR
ncbi:F0F1 ATP synthase subunit B/delta [Gordonia desulfuricans]|uniref:Multifunctional fusion protein n=1 Tax=Gordonia desulfuricans TaxID=89051 RepID=A0A7K3LQ16_9ACTN|nr:F0F1 ATP synthase subunit B/delta [Gordonia desulfuricans]NDK90354.1 F0F1 ATP synthase subunit B/delta [Gordonia desulfuricans]